MPSNVAINNNTGRTVQMFVQFTPALIGVTALLYLLLPFSTSILPIRTYYGGGHGLFTTLSSIFTAVFHSIAAIFYLFCYICQQTIYCISLLFSLTFYLLNLTSSLISFVVVLVSTAHRRVGDSIIDTCHSVNSPLCLPIVGLLYFGSVAAAVIFIVHLAVHSMYWIQERFRSIRGETPYHVPVSYEDLRNSTSNVIGQLWTSTTNELRQRKIIDDIRKIEIENRGKKSISNSDGDGMGENTSYCVVCLSNPKCVVLMPCRHLCVCQDCAEQLRQHSDCLRRQCPLCRAHILETISCYL